MQQQETRSKVQGPGRVRVIFWTHICIAWICLFDARGGGGKCFKKISQFLPVQGWPFWNWNVSGRHRQQHHPQHPHQHRCRDWRWLLGPSRRRKQATWNVDFMAGQPMSPPVHQKFQVSKMEGFLNPIAGKATDVFVRCNLCRSISNKKRTHLLAYTYPIYIYMYVHVHCTHTYTWYTCVLFLLRLISWTFLDPICISQVLSASINGVVNHGVTQHGPPKWYSIAVFDIQPTSYTTCSKSGVTRWVPTI